LRLTLESDDPWGRTLDITIRILSPNVVEVTARPSDSTLVSSMAQSFTAQADEPFYGLGERFSACNQRGQEVMAWCAGGPTGHRDWTYWPVPFVLAGGGYGLLLDTPYRNTFRLCTDFRQVYNVETEGPELTYSIIHGPAPLRVIEGLTDLVGKPPLPPRWSLGVIRNVNGSEARVREEARRLREANIPCSALWYYDTLDKKRNIGWPINPNFFDGEYDDVGQLTRDLKELGYKSQTYLFPYFYAGTENYATGAARGYFVRNCYGDPYLFPHWSVDYDGRVPTTRLCAMLDFTNPDAVAWYQELVRQVVVDLDFDGWMHDFGEDVPADAIFYNGRTGAEMHNLYPVLYQKATYEACMRHKPDASFYARSGYAASQGYVMALWNGDQAITWSYDDGLPSVIPGSLNLGICGCPYIGPDIAGFFNTEGRPGVVSEELWIRWLQLGALSPVMRDLVVYYPIELWTSDRTVESFRRYARLHVSLFPYLYTYARQASRTGAPIMRHLCLCYPDDPAVCDLDYQFLLGNELLVAPVLKPGVETWPVYLPQGEWVNWWDGERYRGPGRVNIPAPLMQIPLLARAGAVIPLLPSTVDTLVEATDPSVRVAGEDLVVELFPSSDGVGATFELWDGTQLSWDPMTGRFAAEGAPTERTYTLRARSWTRPASAAANGRALPEARDSTPGWWYDAEGQVTIAQVRGRDVTARFISYIS